MSARYDKRGFTLFEMLAAVAVAMIIAVFVFAFSNSLIQIMRATDSKIGTEVDANVALDIIARDLEAAVFREGRGVMFAVDAQRRSERAPSWIIGDSPRSADNDFDPLTHRYGWAGSYLRFFTASSAYNAVSYQIIRRAGFSNSLRRRYILFRSVVAKEYTEEEGTNIAEGEYETGAGNYLHPGTIRKGNLHGVFLENVVDFGVRLYVYESGHSATDHSPKGLRLIYPATESGLLDSSERSHHAFTGAGTTYSARYPDVIQVYIRVLDRAGAEELVAAEEIGAPSGTFEDIVARHGRLYTRTVRIAARSI